MLHHKTHLAFYVLGCQGDILAAMPRAPEREALHTLCEARTTVNDGWSG
jgi:hypothetical protein